MFKMSEYFYNYTELLYKLLLFSKQSEKFVLLYTGNQPTKYKIICGFNETQEITKIEDLTTELLKDKWWLGFITYELKNNIYTFLKPKHPYYFNFPYLYFFNPENLIILTKSNKLIILGPQKEEIIKIIHSKIKTQNHNIRNLTFYSMTTKKEYKQKFNELFSHLLNGNIYEINYCINFTAENAKIDEIHTFYNLATYNATSFSCFVKYKNSFLLSASPERFLMKKNKTLLSQPIKGTMKKEKNNIEKIKHLKESIKEKCENIMTVDLVRNDFSLLSKPYSLKVSKLLKISELKTLYQLYSEIKCELKDNIEIKDIIINTFPMASMTGTPKKRALQIIDETENFSREIYSGSVGYISPNMNFDFNVVIRSLLYEKNNKMLSYPVGGAITIYTNANDELNECIAKTKSIEKSLNAKFVCPY